MLHHNAKVGVSSTVYCQNLSNIAACTIGEECTIHAPVWIGNEVKIGDRVKIQAFTFIPDGVTIEDDVFIGPRVTFTNDPKLAIAGRQHWKETLVRKGAKLGAGVIVIAGVIIGKDAIVGAGAVVTKDVPAGETWVGNPARKIRGIKPCVLCAQKVVDLGIG